MQIGGTSSLHQVVASETASAGLTSGGTPLVWGTDLGAPGVFADFKNKLLLQPTQMCDTSLEKLALGYLNAAGIDRHSRLMAWGSSGFGPMVSFSSNALTPAQGYEPGR